MKVVPFPLARGDAAGRPPTPAHPPRMPAPPNLRIRREALAVTATLALIAGALAFGFWLGTLA